MRIRTRTGTEGPAWDPYGWEETEVEHRGRTVVLRTGLGCWVEVDGVRITDREEEVFQKFEEVVGYPVDKIQRWHQKASWTCKQCFGHPVTSVEGYPGETMYLCANGHVVDVHFDRRAIE